VNLTAPADYYQNRNSKKMARQFGGLLASGGRKEGEQATLGWKYCGAAGRLEKAGPPAAA
jgi:hypothetical protein